MEDRIAGGHLGSIRASANPGVLTKHWLQVNTSAVTGFKGFQVSTNTYAVSGCKNLLRLLCAVSCI